MLFKVFSWLISSELGKRVKFSFVCLLGGS